MLRSFLLLVLFLCHQGCLANRRDVDASNLGWQAWLLVDPEPSKHNFEEEEPIKPRRITPKSVFIAPAFSGAPPLPDCAEGYRADSMGRCVKLVQLNHAAQLNFLLQRLNAMYSTPPVEKPFDDLDSSDSNSGPLHVTIPLDLPAEPEENPKESVEVAVVMADMLKENLKNKNQAEGEKSQTVVAVWNVGKNGTQLQEVETTSDLEMQGSNISNSTTPDATKYDVVNDNSSSSTGSSSNSNNSSSSSSSTLSVASIGNSSETVKMPDTAMGLLEEVGSVSSEDGRIGNTSRRNVSSTVEIHKMNQTEVIVPLQSSETIVKKQEYSAEPIETDQKTSETNANNVQRLTSTQRPSSHVRFPTDDEMNYPDSSAYGSDFNDRDSSEYERRPSHVQFPPTYYGDSNPGPRLPSDVHQRPIYWWLPPGWRLDPTTRHQPMLIRFWARMPLLRDPMYDSKMMMDSYQDMNLARRRRPLVF